MPAYSVAWTQLPLVTQLIPVVGHTGISDSDGRVHDFQGNNTIGVGRMAFCKPLRYWQLDESAAVDFEGALRQADKEFRQRNHDIVNNNCHHHVARALNLMAYEGRTDWGAWRVGWRCLVSGAWVKPKYALAVWGPLVVLAAICLLLPLLL